jgi:peptide subunit release factor 1 (eRF1)
MRLIDEYSVIEAFEWAKEKATNGEEKVSNSLEVGIVPILIDMDNKIHKRKLFDSKA